MCMKACSQSDISFVLLVIVAVLCIAALYKHGCLNDEDGFAAPTSIKLCKISLFLWPSNRFVNINWDRWVTFVFLRISNSDAGVIIELLKEIAHMFNKGNLQQNHLLICYMETNNCWLCIISCCLSLELFSIFNVNKNKGEKEKTTKSSMLFVL